MRLTDNRRKKRQILILLAVERVGDGGQSSVPKIVYFSWARQIIQKHQGNYKVLGQTSLIQ